MILYLDTSSLVKLYIQEEHSDSVRAWAEQAEVWTTSRVAYPEVLSALARRLRQGHLDDSAFSLVRNALSSQWQDFSVVDVDELKAGELAVRHGLRALDAIHLAAACDVGNRARRAPFFFSSFDKVLNEAARAEGLEVLEANSTGD